MQAGTEPAPWKAACADLSSPVAEVHTAMPPTTFTAIRDRLKRWLHEDEPRLGRHGMHTRVGNEPRNAPSTGCHAFSPARLAPRSGSYDGYVHEKH